MRSEATTNDRPDLPPRRGLMGRVLDGMLLRDGQPRNDSSPSPQPVEEPYQPEMVAPDRNWERVLAQLETLPEELADIKRSLGEVLHRFDDGLDQLGSESRRLSNEASTLALVADRLQTRLGDLGRALAQERVKREGGGTASTAQYAVPEEPQFHPNGDGVTIILAEVPGFQGLMDVQRALNSLGSASVMAFRNDEASIRVALEHPASARQIVERLQSSISQPVVIEEARPDAQRLRLRFIQGDGRR